MSFLLLWLSAWFAGLSQRGTAPHHPRQPDRGDAHPTNRWQSSLTIRIHRRGSESSRPILIFPSSSYRNCCPGYTRATT
jgi:hypothetical protein